MPYRISRHARQQMAARGIPEQAVDAVMQSPGQVVGRGERQKVLPVALEPGWVGVPAAADRR